MTKRLKKIIQNARPIGKPIFILLLGVMFLIEVIPNLVAILIIGIASLFQYLANKNRTYKSCFESHFREAI